LSFMLLMRILSASRVTRAILSVPSLAMARALWLSTVLGASLRMAAASLTEHPRLTRRTTSVSRCVS